MLYDYGEPGQVWTPDPVDRSHPLNQGLTGWWKGVQPLDGGKYLYDLHSSNVGTAGALVGAATWSSRPGQPAVSLNFNNDGTGSVDFGYIC